MLQPTIIFVTRVQKPNPEEAQQVTLVAQAHGLNANLKLGWTSDEPTAVSHLNYYCKMFKKLGHRIGATNVYLKLRMFEVTMRALKIARHGFSRP
jgi:hypothetical protein